LRVSFSQGGSRDRVWGIPLPTGERSLEVVMSPLQEVFCILHLKIAC
jgi:hypothetical protein